MITVFYFSMDVLLFQECRFGLCSFSVCLFVSEIHIHADPFLSRLTCSGLGSSASTGVGWGKIWAFMISFKFYLVFSRHLAVEQYCSPLWGNC